MCPGNGHVQWGGGELVGGAVKYRRKTKSVQQTQHDEAQGRNARLGYIYFDTRSLTNKENKLGRRPRDARIWSKKKCWKNSVGQRASADRRGTVAVTGETLH